MKFAVFGEILWDIFGKERTIGGAPFNLAAHAKKLGAEVSLISAVGNDDAGQEALCICQSLGLDCEGIAVTGKPTGRVLVRLNDGVPEYDIEEDMAYDHIPLPEMGPDGDVLCFGTLPLRCPDSANTLKTLLERFNWDNVFFDVNIRQNFYTREILEYSLSAATILKVSREEIGVFDYLNPSGAYDDPDHLEDMSRKIMASHPNIRLVIVTLDCDGAFAMERSGAAVYAPKPGKCIVSTVGAGDSFSAAFLVNYLNGESLSDCLYRASYLAGYVCRFTGAVPEYSSELISKVQGR